MSNSLSPKKHFPPTLLRLILLAALVVVITLFGSAQIVYAQSGTDAPLDNLYMPMLSGNGEIPASNRVPVNIFDAGGNADVVYNVGCMQESAGFGLNCTANDISIAKATNIAILDNGCAYPGDTVTFKADFEVLLTAQARYDVGLWFSQDGDPNGDAAKTGMCTAATPAYAPDPPWLDLDQTIAGQEADSCGDINATHNPLYPSVTLTVVCTDDDANGKLDLPNCTSWRQPGDNSMCTSPSQAVPGAPSKCKCDTGFNIDIPVPGQIIVDKVTSPADMTKFDFTLTGGPDSVNLTFALADNDLPYKSVNLMAGTYSVVETANPAYTTVATCNNGSPANAIVLKAGQIVTCTFTNTLVAKPHLAITKVATEETYNAVGDIIHYTIVATNDGNVTVPSVTVSDPFISDLTCTPANGSALLPGESMTCTATHTVTQSDLDAGHYANTACVDDGPMGAAQACADEDVPGTKNPHLSITKVATEASYDAVGDVIHYTIVATNDGNLTLANVTVTDAFVSDLTCTPMNGSTLMPGESITCVATHTISQADLETGFYANTSCVDDGDMGAPQACADEDVPGIKFPHLTITKVADEENYDAVGDIIHYTIIATNDGNLNLPAVTIVDPLIAGLACSPANGSALMPGESMTCTATHEVTLADLDAGHFANTACVDDGELGAPQACADEDVPGIKLPHLMISKAATEETYNAVGDIIHYTIVATNDGNVTLAAVTVTDPLVDGLTCTPATGSALLPGESMTCTATHTVTQSDLDVGHYANTACVDDGEMAAPEVCADEDVPGTKNPHLSITKVATEATYGAVGDVIHYTIVATNDGNLTLASVTVSDPLVDGLTCTPAAGSTLLPGESMTCTATHTVSQSDLDAGHYANTACVDDGEAGAPQTCADEDVPGTTTPHLSITKIAAETSYQAVGDVIHYTIVATNDGNLTLANVTVTDAFVSDLTCTPATGSTLLPGESMSCIATHTISQIDLEAGHFANTSCVDDGDMGAAQACADEDVPGIKLPHLAITKIATEENYDAVGDIINYTIVATNDGNVALTSVTVSDPFISGLTCTPANGSALLPGESMTCVATHAITQSDLDAGHFANTACVDDGEMGALEACASEDVPGVKNPHLSITKVATEANYDEVGDMIHYTIVATNDGNLTLANVTVTDAFVSDLTCTPMNGSTLMPGESMTCAATHTVTQSDLETGFYANTSCVDDGDMGAPQACADEDVPGIQMPILSLEKTGTFDAGMDGYANPGELISYVFTVSNIGNIELHNVSVTDPLISPIKCTDTTIPVGGSITCAGSYVVTQVDIDTGFVYNMAVADSDESPPDEDDHNQPLPQNPMIDVEKLVSVDGGMSFVDADMEPFPSVSEGSTVEFKFVVKNVGNVTLSVITLMDTDFDLSSCAITSPLAPNEEFDCSLPVMMAVPGAHANTATTSGEGPQAQPVADSDDVNVMVTDVLPEIMITKSANPTSVTETGGNVEFTIVVINNSLEKTTVDSLVDSDFDLAAHCPDAWGTVLKYGESYTCVFTEWISGDFSGAAHENTATVTASDNDGNTDTASDDETVTFTDVLPEISITKTAAPSSVPETGGNVVFTFLVKNIGVEDVTLTSLSDTVFGDLNGQGDCVTGGLIPVGGSYSCSITKLLASDSLTAHYNLVTAVGTDNDGSTDTATDDESVTFDDILPEIMLTKSAMPTSVPETGGDVEFTIVVTNNSLEKTTVDSLVDSDFDLAAHCPDAVGTALAYGESYTCIFTKWVSGDYSGMAHENTATVVASDNDGNTDTAIDDATVTYTDVLPDISVTKTANPTYIIAPSGDVTFNFVVKNNGLEAATITALSDDKFGTLTGDADCQVDTVLAAGSSCSFAATFTVSGAGGTSHVNLFTATASDNDGNSDTASDDATVEILATTSKIAPTATTCQQYRDGTALDYTELFYNVSKGKIGSVSPGVIFYYSTITAPAANFTLGFSQSNDLAWKAMAVKQVVLWDSKCVKVQSAAVNKSNGSATISVTGATPGATYYLSVKPDPGSLTGIPLKTPYPTANYTFSTSMNGSIIATSPDSIAVRPKDMAMSKSEALSAISLYIPSIRQ